MKIYVALDEEKCFNPYASILIKRLREIDSTLEIRSGISIFWDEEIFTYNIIHIHWPDLLLKNTSRTPDELRERLCKLKKNGAKIVATCHNFVPHFAKFSWQTEAYSIIYKACDLTLHMGNVSLEKFRGEYPNCRHEILQHHIYDDRYNNIPSKAEAAKELGLNATGTYILCLGAFRDKQEQDLLLGLSRFLKRHSLKILAPSFFTVKKPTGIRSTLRYIKAKIKCAMLDIRYNIITCASIIPEEKIPLYGAVADLMLLQRINILNSGNIPMGFYLGKVVIGPNTGNVGEILKETGNPTFNVNDTSTLQECIKHALELAKSNFGEKNRAYAKDFMSSKKITLQLLEYYRQITV